METLRSSDLRKVLEFIGFTTAAVDLEELARRTLQALHRLVPSDIVGIHRMDIPTVRNSGLMDPQTELRPEDVALFNRYVDQHPIISRYLSTSDARPHRFSDFFDWPEFRRGVLYNEFYRPIHVAHQMGAVLVRTPSVFIGCAVNREARDFSDRERLLLDAVRPHLARAFERARAWTEARLLVRELVGGLEGNRRAVLLLSEDGHIALAGERGRSWFASYFGGDARPGDRLPDRVDAWLRDRRDGSERVAEPPLVIERQGHRFVVRLLPEAGPATHRILVLEEHRDLMAAEELECFGLTHREAEILAWVSHGKSDAEIASILHVSQRTVAKHLEHTYEKLDVHSRTAAIARVRGVDPQ